MTRNVFSDKQLFYLQALIAVVFCIIPLFVTFPYKINLYLAWEGAYRIAEGQVPFRDFGMPLGYGFWLLPALFFKIFGPFMSSLIKAQVVINMLSIVALDRIWRILNVNQSVRTIGTAIFCITYVLIHFWPWYNHTVYVFEWISIAFLLASFNASSRSKILLAGFAGIFGFMSVFTKQDIGALGILLSIALIIGDLMRRKDLRPGLIYLISLILFGTLIIWPLTNYEFSYWFNYGQSPHHTRFSMMDYLDELFSRRTLIYRIYFVAMVLAAVYLFKRRIGEDKAYSYVMLFLLTLGAMVQSVLAGVTSYVPLTSHFYFHAFFFVFILKFIDDFAFKMSGRWAFISALILIAFVWSQDPWRYSRRLISRIIPPAEMDSSTVNRHTYIVKPDSIQANRTVWVKSKYESLDNVRMPRSTVEGFDWIVTTYGDRDNFKLLNMSELPQLYYEMDIKLEASPHYPLWFHDNVAFFDRENAAFCGKIEDGEYDLVLFEVIPNLNNFYPPEVRACLRENYRLVKTFTAPRVPEFSTIEVYERTN